MRNDVVFKCDACGETFSNPHVREIKENLDGERGIWLDRIESCPHCGSEDFNECKEDDE